MRIPFRKIPSAKRRDSVSKPVFAIFYFSIEWVFCQQNYLIKPLTNPKIRSIIQSKKATMKTRKSETSSKRVRTRCEPHMNSAFLPLRSFGRVKNFRRSPRYGLMRYALLRMNSGGITVYNRPVELSRREFFVECGILLPVRTAQKPPRSSLL